MTDRASFKSYMAVMPWMTGSVLAFQVLTVGAVSAKESAMPSDDEVGSDDAHSDALVTFAANFEFAKRLVRVLGADNLKLESREDIGRWLALIIENAEVEIDTAIAHDALTPEIAMLVKEVEAVRTWAADLMRLRLRDIEADMPLETPE